MRKIELPDYDPAAFADRYGPWAVIAGASEGTGACFAEQLARMGINLMLVARRLEPLETLGKRLADEFGVEYRAVSVDLRETGTGQRLLSAAGDLDVGLYVSNAGADGTGNSFFDSPLERLLGVLTMNATTLVEAVHGFGNRFRTRGKGGVIVMSSVVGLGGQPWLVMYTGTKAFELNFAESLWAELQGQGVDIIGVAAPTMDTPELRRGSEAMGFDVSNAYDPAEVVHLSLAKLGQEPLIIVPDGPDEAKIPQIETDRKTRLVMLSEWRPSLIQAV